LRVLVLSQVIPQWYVDVIQKAFCEECEIDYITGSNIRGNVIKCPEHEPASLVSRFRCWWKYYCFIKKWVKSNKNQNYDFVFGVSNPPINSYVGLKLGRIFKAPFIYMNWDLYPQIIERKIKNPVVKMVCRGWHVANSIMYPRIDKMLTIGNVMAESINLPLKKKIDVGVIPIAVDRNYLKPVDKRENLFIKENGLEGKFIALFSGKIGLGHNVDTILECASMMSDDEKAAFVFIGHGPKVADIQKYIDENNSKNVFLFPLQDDNMFPYSIACGDVAIVSQEEGMSDLFMPSKTYSQMAVGEPIIGICNQEDDLGKLILSKNIGEVCKADSTMLKNIIVKLMNDEEKLKEYSSNSYKVSAEYASDVIAEKYKEIFGKINKGVQYAYTAD